MHQNLWTGLNYVWPDEGGFVIRASEPGGAGNLGVSFEAFREYSARHGQPDVTYDDLRKLDRPHAAAIYKEDYWDVIRGDELQSGVDYWLFDSAINDGTGGAARILQESLGEPHARMMSVLVAKANAQDPKALLDTLYAINLEHKRADSGWQRYGRGWTNRLNRRLDRARAMVDGTTPKLSTRLHAAVNNAAVTAWNKTGLAWRWGRLW